MTAGISRNKVNERQKSSGENAKNLFLKANRRNTLVTRAEFGHGRGQGWGSGNRSSGVIMIEQAVA